VHLCAQIYARIFRHPHSARRVKNIGAYSAPVLAIAPFELKTITMQPCFPPSLATARLFRSATPPPSCARISRGRSTWRECAPLRGDRNALRAFRFAVIVGYRRDYRRESIARNTSMKMSDRCRESERKKGAGRKKRAGSGRMSMLRCLEPIARFLETEHFWHPCGYRRASTYALATTRISCRDKERKRRREKEKETEGERERERERERVAFALST